ncbi:MAG: hypothetical protein KY447_10665, partial [Actinobacteria bacterium]|nr:hypothetical protein [Actinomycetota bacterium]
MRIRPSRLPIVVVSVAALLVTACGGSELGADVGGKGPTGDDIVAQVASYDLVAGRSGRFIVGVLAADGTRLVSFGSVELRFSYLGASARRVDSVQAGPVVTASFLPIPGQRFDGAASGPRFVEPSEAVGVYGAPDVLFDRAGFWE